MQSPIDNTIEKLMDIHLKILHQKSKDIYEEYEEKLNEPFEITVKTVTGKTFNINVKPFDTIYSIKQQIYKIDNILLDQQRIIFNGKQLDEKTTVDRASIIANSTIHLVLSIRGGMYHETSSRSDFLSLNFIMKRDKGLSMIQYMRKKYNANEIMDEINQKLMECTTDDEINKVFSLIEKFYVE
jgi:hypothetical protein